MTKKVPHMTPEAIERNAAALLAEYAQAKGVVIAPPIPIEDIIEKHLKLGIEFDDTHSLFGIPRSGSEPDILGAMFFDERRIVIDESLDPEESPETEGRYRFTLAHEGGGHWRLHHRHFATKPGGPALTGGSIPPSVICRSSKAKERVEWQADYYASCLLMPRDMVLVAWKRAYGDLSPIVYEKLREAPMARRPPWRGPRPIGWILAEVFEPEHAYLFGQVAKRFAGTFGVSMQAMQIRLETLGLLLREDSQAPVPVAP